MSEKRDVTARGFSKGTEPRPLTKVTCCKPMYGLYGARTICSRPAGHLGKHNPIWDYRDWTTHGQ